MLQYEFTALKKKMRGIKSNPRFLFFWVLKEKVIIHKFQRIILLEEDTKY